MASPSKMTIAPSSTVLVLPSSSFTFPITPSPATSRPETRKAKVTHYHPIPTLDNAQLEMLTQLRLRARGRDRIH
ncbi:hypothetical protein N7527_001760 [Penicillium freii]|nr:hypothetical protein N7527_001760 [Penicillium freii]